MSKALSVAQEYYGADIEDSDTSQQVGISPGFGLQEPKVVDLAALYEVDMYDIQNWGVEGTPIKEVNNG